MKILHFAVENFARIPANLVRAERQLGHESLLMTLYPSRHRYHDEDICLNLPFVDARAVQSIKKLIHSERETPVYTRKSAGQGPPVWKPGNALSEFLFNVRDKIWEPTIETVLQSIQIESYDVLFLDGGLGFLRNDTFVPKLKATGVKIVVGYYGSDLRTRGIIPEIDSLADYRFTMEFDHTLLYPGIDFVYFPFRLPPFPERNDYDIGKIRVGHSPTNRAVKRTDKILEQLSLIQKKVPIEIVLIEGLPQQEALALKKTCDLFIDCIGELGYGVSGLEAMAMGIPTAAEIWPDFEKTLGPHPFINVTAETLAETLEPFCRSEKLRRERGEKSRAWVTERHDSIRIAKRMLDRLTAK